MKKVLNSYKNGPDLEGFFDLHGGRFVAETLMPLILELEEEYNKAKNDSSFKRETEVCNSCLKKQLKNINPSLIVSLGQLTTEALLDNKENFTDLKDQIHSYDNIDFLVTYHPEDLLKNPELKKHTWKDFKYIRDNYLDGSN